MDRVAKQEDLARAAGVSVSTVSRALSNARGISAELRLQIQTLAQDLGYRPRGAEGIRQTARVYITGSVMSGGLVAFYSALMDGISESARLAGIDLEVRMVQKISDAARLKREAEESPMGGTMVVGFDPTPELREAFGPDHPLVLVNTFDPQMQYDCVAPNNFYGASWATRLLLEAGHRHLLHIRDQRRWTTHQREQGFLAAISTVPGATGEIIDVRDDGDAVLARAVAAKKAGKAKWTAAFGVHDNAAIRFIHALEDAGLSVPEDVSLIGFDDLPPAAMVTPRLATMRVDCAAMGRQAVQLLQRRLADPTAAIVQVETAVHPVAGGSIGKP